jgi:hypothetical protein
MKRRETHSRRHDPRAGGRRAAGQRRLQRRGRNLEGGRLSFLGANGEALAAFAPTEPTRLADSSWIVRAVNNDKQAVVGVPEEVTISLRFGADGTFDGRGSFFDGNLAPDEPPIGGSHGLRGAPRSARDLTEHPSRT